MKHKVLLCDDNYNVHTSLSKYMEAEGIILYSAYDGESALEALKAEDFDIAILDIMLPGMDGLDVCREIRKINEKIYIIMLSAKGEEIDRIVGLEVGADHYVVKPFSPRELTIFIRKTLKRLDNNIQSENKIVFEDLEVYPESYQVFINGELIQLTPKEVEVLSCLIMSNSRVVSRESLLNKAWGYDYVGEERTVDSVVKRLRSKLQHEGSCVTVKSVYGVGYQLIKDE